MNNVLKQRLVGALILVALGVVFWPIIFVEPGTRPAVEQPRIPPSPAVDTTPIEPPEMTGLRPSREVEAQEESRARELSWPVPAPASQNKRATVAESKPKPKPKLEPKPKAADAAVVDEKNTAASSPPAQVAPSKRTRTEAPQKLKVDSDGVPVAWILQVASVSSSEKAEQLRQRLLVIDQKAYVKRVKRAERVLYRVYIGPKFERAALEALQPRIDTEFKVKSMIARYVP